ncbi:hypothetical protein ACUUMC_18495 [Paenarthrobacter nitroguajacolicus]
MDFSTPAVLPMAAPFRGNYAQGTPGANTASRFWMSLRSGGYVMGLMI